MKIVARIHSDTDISEIFNQLTKGGYDVVAPTKKTIYAYFDELKVGNQEWLGVSVYNTGGYY